jgi:O-antigen/teichoic acid export membrane protein
MPVVVRGLGPAQFGLLALAWTVVGYAGSFDLGLGRAATKRVSEAAWAGADGRVATIVATTTVTQGGFGILTGIVLWLLAPLLGRLLVADAGDAAVNAAALLRVLAIALPAVLVSNGLRAVLEGLHRFDLVNAGRAPIAAAMYLIPLGGVVAGADLRTIVAGLVVARWSGAALFLLLYARAAPSRGAGRPALHELRDLLRFGGWVAVSNTVIPLVAYLERFVISALRGPVALAYYAAPQELVSKLNVVPAAVAGVLFPTFSGLSAGGDGTELLRRIRQGVRVVALLLVTPVAILLVTATPVLNSWLGPDYGLHSAAVMRLLAFALFLTGLAFVPFALVEGVGRPDIVAKYHIVELPLYAAVLWYLVSRYGALGAAAAWTLRMSVTAPLFFGVALRAAGIRLGPAFAGSVARTLGASLACLAVAGALPTVLSSAMAQIAAAVAVASGFAVVAWLWLLEEADRATLRLTVRRLRTRADIDTLATDG